jgi:hypothetical protein
MGLGGVQMQGRHHGGPVEATQGLPHRAGIGGGGQGWRRDGEAGHGRPHEEQRGERGGLCSRAQAGGHRACEGHASAAAMATATAMSTATAAATAMSADGVIALRLRGGVVACWGFTGGSQDVNGCESAAMRG